MPTYEYVCRACAHEFEVFQSMTEAPKRTCPACGKRTLERKIGTGAAVLFKGSGFYQTDYRSESYKKAAEAESKPAGESKSEAKPEPKTEPKPAAESKPKTSPARVAKPSTPKKAPARNSKR
ncbi:MAG: zinc ribbon domain-containing protein [Phycisphaerae bacterium]|nr:zinc ribbon domain-containing protein [Phycisphaerae bacterium]